MVKAVNITAGGKEYKLKLSGATVCELEEKYGSLLGMFESFDLSSVGSIKLSIIIELFCASLKKYHPELSKDERMDVYDAYCDENGINGVMETITGIMESGGYIAESDGKNA
ncbi:MAG: hypothetical protein PUF72_02905 [Clostridiales bacterium]|nr:hypothetical protein [Clostridiales bacterium]